MDQLSRVGLRQTALRGGKLGELASVGAIEHSRPGTRGRACSKHPGNGSTGTYISKRCFMDRHLEVSGRGEGRTLGRAALS